MKVTATHIICRHEDIEVELTGVAAEGDNGLYFEDVSAVGLDGLTIDLTDDEDSEAQVVLAEKLEAMKLNG